MIAPGSLLAGKYRVLALLGEGAMGAVYRAHHEALGKSVAIKVMLPELAHNVEYRTRFEREARVCAQLRHPGVVGVHDVGVTDDCPYLVMDLLSGFSLRDLMESSHRISVERTLRIAAQLADALVAAHEARLVHRDLKPENIMLEDDERPVIVDFGLAFIDSALANTGRMTEHGIVMGTPNYISPEQARAADVTPVADVYSLGCIMFEMITGAPPFNGDGYAVLLAEHMFVQAPTASSQFAETPPAVDELIAAMLVKDPAQRPNARAVHAMLLDIITGERGVAKPRVARSRISRMVPAAPHRELEPSAAAIVAPPQLKVTLVDGASDPTTAAALVTAGAMGELRCVADEQRGDAEVDGVVVFGANATHVAAWSSQKPAKPVMVVVGNDNLEVAMAMLRAGATEVVTADAGAAAIVAKLRKMISTAQRKAKRS
jgi:serine/threonine protein kinase